MCYHPKFGRFRSNGTSVITGRGRENVSLHVPTFRVAQVIGTDTDQLATYDFLLVIHSNHEPILYRFRDKRRFRSKMANFPTPPGEIEILFLRESATSKSI